MRKNDQIPGDRLLLLCSACVNSCANFQHVGGHASGGETYFDGIATGWEAGAGSLEVATEFNDLCAGWSRCVNACLVRIDVSWINTVGRDRINGGASGEFDGLIDGLMPDRSRQPSTSGSGSLVIWDADNTREYDCTLLELDWYAVTVHSNGAGRVRTVSECP